MDAFGKEYHECLLSRSISSVPSSFKMHGDRGVFKRRWRNNILFKKDTEKVVLLQDLIKTIIKVRTEKILCTFVSCTKYVLQGP